MTSYTPKHSAAVRTRAATVQNDLCAQNDAWGRGGWTRRRFIGGAGMVGAAALASQLVTTRVAYGSTAATATENTLIVIFMRGAADGLRILVPNSPDLGLTYLQQVRPALVPASGNLVALPGATGWGLNSALKPLVSGLWGSGELAFVPGVSTPDIPRSHFEAQRYLEMGGNPTSSTGWLDRVLTAIGPGTTFRAVASGGPAPQSFAGPEPEQAMNSLATFKLNCDPKLLPSLEVAMTTLYRGLDLPIAQDVTDAMAAIDTAATASAASTPQNGAVYPDDDFGAALHDLAGMLRAEVGLQVATVDVGGWDTHTGEVNDLDRNLADVAKGLMAFMTDLGPTRRKRVTVVVQTEFGRRIQQNGSGGCDHGHGSLMWLLGGGLSGSGVLGNWQQLSSTVNDSGDVPGFNNPFNVLGEVVQKRLNTGAVSSIFPGLSYAPLGVATTT